MNTTLRRRARARCLLVLFGLAALVVMFAARPSNASVITLTNGNATVKIDSESSAGLYDWRVDGFDLATQQWFWWCIGDTGPEAPISSLTPTAPQYTGTKEVLLTYTEARFTLTLSYDLTGFPAGTGVSDLEAVVSVRNDSGSPLDFHLFTYADFRMPGSPADDTAEITGYNYAEVDQGDYYVGCSISVSGNGSTGYTADRVRAALTTDSPSLLASLTDGGPTDLDDTDDSFAGPGNVAWAMQWDRQIATGQMLTVQHDISTQVPEPTTLALLALGGLTFAARRRRATS